MRSIQLTTLGTVLLASALPVVGAVLVIVDHPRAVSNNVPELLQSELHLDVRTLPGKISRKAGKFIFGKITRGLFIHWTIKKKLGNFPERRCSLPEQSIPKPAFCMYTKSNPPGFFTPLHELTSATSLSPPTRSPARLSLGMRSPTSTEEVPPPQSTI